MDIGTAKPPRDISKSQNFISQGIAHHLVDIKNPDQSYTVAQYKRGCVRSIKSIVARGKLPIIVGGTGLYIKAVVDNLSIPHVKANPLLRKELERTLHIRGLNFLYNKLVRLDPEAAYIIDPKNPRRVIRALEIALGSGKPFSETRRRGKPLFEFLQLGIHPPPQKLRGRIDHRINNMVKAGLVGEVKRLIKQYPTTMNAFEAIGYRELISHIQGEISLEKAVGLMKKNTWQFAKRQMTWFRKDKSIHWITKSSEADKLVKDFLV